MTLINFLEDHPLWSRELYPIFAGPRSTRLLEFLPARKWVDDIACKLYVYTVRKADHEDHQPVSKYKALSYAWGSTQKKIPIIVNGVQVPVTINLECALRHLREPEEPVLLWVDALVSDSSTPFWNREQKSKNGLIGF